MHEPSARQTANSSLEGFTIFDGDGEVWRALRQPLGGGNYRTPDDPTASDDFVGRPARGTERTQVERLHARDRGVGR